MNIEKIVIDNNFEKDIEVYLELIGGEILLEKNNKFTLELKQPFHKELKISLKNPEKESSSIAIFIYDPSASFSYKCEDIEFI